MRETAFGLAPPLRLVHARHGGGVLKWLLEQNDDSDPPEWAGRLHVRSSGRRPLGMEARVLYHWATLAVYADPIFVASCMARAVISRARASLPDM